jgi:hypothetical protein
LRPPPGQDWPKLKRANTCGQIRQPLVNNNSQTITTQVCCNNYGNINCCCHNPLIIDDNPDYTTYYPQQQQQQQQYQFVTTLDNGDNNVSYPPVTSYCNPNHTLKPSIKTTTTIEQTYNHSNTNNLPLNSNMYSVQQGSLSNIPLESWMQTANENGWVLTFCIQFFFSNFYDNKIIVC